MPDEFPLAARGVYCQPYLINGRREFFAVDSRGEQVAVRLVRNGQDAKSVIADLWDELNEADPVPIHHRAPSLSVVR